jgi:hypothetical protein
MEQMKHCSICHFRIVLKQQKNKTNFVSPVKSQSESDKE